MSGRETQKVRITNPMPTFGCFSVALSLLTIAAVMTGVRTPWGVLHIDFFPAAVRIEAPGAGR